MDIRRGRSEASPARGRSIEVDFFCGVVLIVIVLDHIPGSTLTHLMLHVYALCDSAEVFVFVGGYASAAGVAAGALLSLAARAVCASPSGEPLAMRCAEFAGAVLSPELIALPTAGAQIESAAMVHATAPGNQQGGEYCRITGRIEGSWRTRQLGDTLVAARDLDGDRHRRGDQCTLTAFVPLSAVCALPRQRQCESCGQLPVCLEMKGLQAWRRAGCGRIE
ncbi:hypothetical protein LMG27177_02627 [Paraburkholderia fynbosensis]|uniref:Uncharacterized protein n=1 Tax=Paraburkholderia fynbosensis TaxID=1200993 RepID=A0A6J5FYW9_9BURK|nr:hypothetical protein LMG27177_02627 [Paraburkholderia fynbosensis]